MRAFIGPGGMASEKPYRRPDTNPNRGSVRGIYNHPLCSILDSITVCPWMFIPIILYSFMVSSRDFNLAHRDLFIPMGSWAAVEPNGMGLPSRLCPGWLGALLPSPPRAFNNKL